MLFRFFAFRFEFRARGTVYFPRGKAGNVFRGALGLMSRHIACSPACVEPQSCIRRSTCAHARLFEPEQRNAPSGFADLPRPFVLRAAHLNGRTFEPGCAFFVDVHVFDVQQPPLAHLAGVFHGIACEGIGPGRGKAELTAMYSLDTAGRLHAVDVQSRLPEPSVLDLAARETACRLRIKFIAPTELKGALPGAAPEFPILFARVRDRISTLRAFYGDGPLDIPFRDMADRAENVRIVRSRIENASVVRRSSRTGQTHGIGGLTGSVEYEGKVGEFTPFLQAAYWTGVGRHTVWGNGVVQTIVLDRAEPAVETGPAGWA